MPALALASMLVERLEGLAAQHARAEGRAKGGNQDPEHARLGSRCVRTGKAVENLRFSALSGLAD
jgi:hypothetical protein